MIFFPNRLVKLGIRNLIGPFVECIIIYIPLRCLWCRWTRFWRPGWGRPLIQSPSFPTPPTNNWNMQRFTMVRFLILSYLFPSLFFTSFYYHLLSFLLSFPSFFLLFAFTWKLVRQAGRSACVQISNWPQIHHCIILHCSSLQPQLELIDWLNAWLIYWFCCHEKKSYPDILRN